jgi:hypothetical protein
MKEVAILLLAALLLNGCSSTTPSVQTTAGGTWQAKMAGGSSSASGFSFITVFSVGSNGTLSISYFQFLNSNSGQCLPSGGTESGSMILTVSSNDSVTGTFSYLVQSGGNTLTLNGAVTGTAANGITLSGTSITGTWMLTGSSACTAIGTFTMNQS